MSLGATGIILATVVPHLLHRSRGGPKTGECILLEEDNTARFAQYSFSVSSFLVHKKGIDS